MSCSHLLEPKPTEERLGGFDLPKGVFLVGNYVGGIGVTMLLEQAARVAMQVTEMT